jgi:WD40 repeat protein
MSQIFLSHSSQNDFAAIAISEWLKKEGWDDQFLDIHPKQGIAAGERWERALYQAANRCDVVLFLISKAWLASDWCLKEFRLAYRLNKRIFGLLIEDIKVSDLSDEITNVWQMVNLGSGTDHQIFEVVHPDTGDQGHVTFSKNGLVRLRTGLNKAGIAPNFFDWPLNNDLDRAPYRGMRPIDEDDAGIFFGREVPVIELLAHLRGLRETPLSRFMVILGASGAGKSSFLRAGILPRLKRDDHCFLPLPIVRPEQSAMWGDNGFLNALGRAFSNRQMNDITRGKLREVLEKKDIDELSEMLRQLADKAAIPAPDKKKDADIPTLVLSIDQGEELFQSKGANESEMLLDLIRNLLIEHTDLPLLILITIRSDSYDQLQTAKLLEGIPQQSYGLPPMPKGSYKEIIEKPAERLLKNDKPLIVDPRLTDKLLKDIDEGGGKDVLPLLAFTLERLYLEYGSKGSLSLEDYNKMGGIKGAIDAAVEKAFQDAENDPRLPNDREQQKHLLRRGFIPWLAGIDLETQKPRRRAARRNEIPAEAWPMIEHLIANRLLATDINAQNSEITVEPVHDALLRQWGLIVGWLQEDFAVLAVLEGVQRASRDWEANTRDSEYLVHSSGRLEEAKRIEGHKDMTQIFTSSDQDYLFACKRQRQDEIRRLRRRATIYGVLAIVAVIAGVVAGWQWFEADLSKKKEVEAKNISQNETRKAKITLSQSDFLQGIDKIEKKDTSAGLAYLASAIRNHPDQQNTSAAARIVNLFIQRTFYLPLTEPLLHENWVNSAVFSLDGTKIVTASWDKAARVWDAATGWPLTEPLRHWSTVNSAVFSPDGTKILTASDDNNCVRVWDAATGKPLSEPYEETINSAIFSPDGTKILTTSKYDHTARVWDAATGRPLTEPLQHKGPVNSAVFSPNGNKILTASKPYDHTARMWDAATGKPLIEPLQHEYWVNSAVFSPDGTKILTASYDNTARVWNATTGMPLTQALQHGSTVKSAVFSPDGTKILTTSDDNTARVWDAATGRPLTEFAQDWGSAHSPVFSPDGTKILTISRNDAARVWDTTTGKPLTESLHRGSTVNSAVFSPDGTKILTASDDNTARVWDTASGRPLIEPLQHGSINIFGPNGTKTVNSAVFSPDGTKILTASKYDNTARVWDASMGKPLIEFLRHKYRVNSAIFSPDGTRILTISGDGTARVWDAATGKPLIESMQNEYRVNSAVFNIDGTKILTISGGIAMVWDTASGRLLTEPSQINIHAFSPDGTKIITISENHTSRVWDVVSGKPLTEPMLHGDSVRSAIFSQDGTKVVTVLSDKTAMVWDATTGRPLTEPLQHDGWVESAVFSPDATKILIVALNHHSARVWDIVSGKPLTDPMRHGDSVRSAIFSQDGTKVVTTSSDMTARVWNATTGKPLTEPLQHDDWVKLAVFSPDGSKILTVCEHEQTARVWDTTTGRPLTDPLQAEDKVNSAVFSPDGSKILIATGGFGSTNTARVYPIAPASTVPVPDWLPLLAEAVSGYHINNQSVLEPVSPTQILHFREQFRNSKDKDPYSQIARWFFADKATRPASPYNMDANTK